MMPNATSGSMWHRGCSVLVWVDILVRHYQISYRPIRRSYGSIASSAGLCLEYATERECVFENFF